MNCDMAFDLMTDPNGGRSQVLREHLAQCPRCRQMQATLAPALDWLTDAQRPDEEPLPAGGASNSGTSASGGAQTVVLGEAVEIARLAAESLAQRTDAPGVRFRRWLIAGARSAALVAAGAGVALAFVPHYAPPAAPLQGAGECRRHDLTAANAAEKSIDELRRLIANCAVCHDSVRKVELEAQHQGAIERRGDWLLAAAVHNFQTL